MLRGFRGAYRDLGDRDALAVVDLAQLARLGSSSSSRLVPYYCYYYYYYYHRYYYNYYHDYYNYYYHYYYHYYACHYYHYYYYYNYYYYCPPWSRRPSYRPTRESGRSATRPPSCRRAWPA